MIINQEEMNQLLHWLVLITLLPAPQKIHMYTYRQIGFKFIEQISP